MAITGHTTFAVFQRYNNPSEEDSKGWYWPTRPGRW